ncbi:hypothetical protein K438DRAFT_1755019 [Mycena galopus ATCC 62051]|nr:hypothetical protein K438DRAFT_1755019 [Mycena galopus ATCC 62051]
MWWDPQQEDFEQGNTVMCSLGKLVYSILCLLEEAACQLAGQYQTYCVTVEVKGETISPLFGQLVESLIHWGIVIHGFIDGYSRLITGLWASDNNTADTVLELFLNAANVYGVPSRIVHNVHIERLWVNVTAQLPQEEEDLSKDELEVFGINWQGLCDNNILHSQAQNNSTTEGSSSWVGHTGPPPDLSQVIVQPPVGTLTEEEGTDLYNSFSHLIGSAEDGDIILLWSQALAHVRVLYPDVF